MTLRYKSENKITNIFLTGQKTVNIIIEARNFKITPEFFNCELHFFYEEPVMIPDGNGGEIASFKDVNLNQTQVISKSLKDEINPLAATYGSNINISTGLKEGLFDINGDLIIKTVISTGVYYTISKWIKQ